MKEKEDKKEKTEIPGEVVDSFLAEEVGVETSHPTVGLFGQEKEQNPHPVPTPIPTPVKSVSDSGGNGSDGGGSDDDGSGRPKSIMSYIGKEVIAMGILFGVVFFAGLAILGYSYYDDVGKSLYSFLGERYGTDSGTDNDDDDANYTPMVAAVTNAAPLAPAPATKTIISKPQKKVEKEVTKNIAAKKIVVKKQQAPKVPSLHPARGLRPLEVGLDFTCPAKKTCVVEWGDGGTSENLSGIQKFSHTYNDFGIFKASVYVIEKKHVKQTIEGGEIIVHDTEKKLLFQKKVSSAKEISTGEIIRPGKSDLL